MKPTTAVAAAASRRLAGRCRNAKNEASIPYQWKFAALPPISISVCGANTNSATSSARASRVSNTERAATQT